MSAQLGAVTHGTLRTEDLLSVFAEELRYQLSKHPDHARRSGRKELVKLAFAAEHMNPDNEFAGELVSELEAALSAFAPPYAYFGANEGDGTDFGFWPAIDALDQAVSDGEVLQLPAGDEIPSEWTGEVMFVTDHGNVTFGYIGDDRVFHEVWSCV